MEFLSTLSLRRATASRLPPVISEALFLSTLSLRRATVSLRCPCYVPHHFYPRSPCGERPMKEPTNTRALEFLSTLSLRRATLAILQHCRNGIISIHALLAESDGVMAATITPTYEFLSTLSLRRATNIFGGACQAWRDFYPRSPCGERRPLIFSVQPRKKISIHALLAESDEPTATGNDKDNIFLSTLSLRRATAAGRFLLS